MKRVVRNITGKAEEDLVHALLDQVRSAKYGVDVAVAVATGRLDTEAARQQMTGIEHDGDECRRVVVNFIRRSFTTPIDREDMFRLSRSIDDVLDNLRDFVREYDLLALPPDELLADVLHEIESSVSSLDNAVNHLLDGHRSLSGAALLVRKNDIRQRYQTAMADLLVEPLSATTLRRREVLRRLDVVGLRLGEAADALADGAVKRG